MAAHVGIRESTERSVTGARSSIASLRAALGEVNRRRRDPHLGAVAVLLGDAVERGARIGQLAQPNLRQHDSRAQVDGERVLAGEHPLDLLRVAELGKRVLEPALSGVQQASRVVQGQLSSGISSGTERQPGPLDPLLGLVEPSEPRQ